MIVRSTAKSMQSFSNFQMRSCADSETLEAFKQQPLYLSYPPAPKHVHDTLVPACRRLNLASIEVIVCHFLLYCYCFRIAVTRGRFRGCFAVRSSRHHQGLACPALDLLRSTQQRSKDIFLRDTTVGAPSPSAHDALPLPAATVATFSTSRRFQARRKTTLLFRGQSRRERSPARAAHPPRRLRSQQRHWRDGCRRSIRRELRSAPRPFFHAVAVRGDNNPGPEQRRYEPPCARGSHLYFVLLEVRW